MNPNDLFIDQNQLQAAVENAHKTAQFYDFLILTFLILGIIAFSIYIFKNVKVFLSEGVTKNSKFQDLPSEEEIQREIEIQKKLSEIYGRH